MFNWSSHSQIKIPSIRVAGISTPGCAEIYFQIASTLDEAKQTFAREEWHKHTYCEFDLALYKDSDEAAKSKLLFESLCRGLRLIAAFDHLDRAKVEGIIDAIQTNGTEMELTYDSAINGKYMAEVVYHVPRLPMGKAEFRLKLTNLQNADTGMVRIDTIDPYYAPYSFGNIAIQKNEVVMKGRTSLRAEISRKQDKLPDEYRFKISDILQ